VSDFDPSDPRTFLALNDEPYNLSDRPWALWSEPLTLSAEEFAAFKAMLDAPPNPTPALVALLAGKP
jgi:hypothetical protein